MFRFIPELISRITIGWVFFESGLGKLQNLDKVTGYFESLHIPFASIQAPFVSTLELVCGSCILLGLFPRLASIPLLGIMLVAIRTAKWEDITSFSSLLEMSEFLNIVVLLWILVYGAQCLSLGKTIQTYIWKKKN
jgi:putative oxidoreductase